MSAEWGKVCPGCGGSVVTQPDDEGFRDCCTCGIWYNEDECAGGLPTAQPPDLYILFEIEATEGVERCDLEHDYVGVWRAARDVLAFALQAARGIGYGIPHLYLHEDTKRAATLEEAAAYLENGHPETAHYVAINYDGIYEYLVQGEWWNG